MGKPNIKEEREFHDHYFTDHSPRKRENEFYDPFSKDIILDELFADLPELKNKKVLYYGCGENISILERLYACEANVTCFDLSEVALKKIQSRYPEAKLIVADAHQLAFKDGQFDLILGRGILHHLDISISLAEIKRILTRAGIAVFIEPLGINPVISLYRALTPASRTKDEHPFGFREIKMIQSNFPSCACRYYFFMSLIPTVLKPFLRKTKLFEDIFIRFNEYDKKLFRVLPFLRYMAWIGVFRLSK
jgi:ubiquinone/menaquinone biosynthesis C-methylase UbiE